MESKKGKLIKYKMFSLALKDPFWNVSKVAKEFNQPNKKLIQIGKDHSMSKGKFIDPIFLLILLYSSCVVFHSPW